MLNYPSLDKHFEAPTTSFSQVPETGLSGVPRKRTSSQLTELQLSELKKKFKSDPYIKGIEKELLANNLGITTTAVTNWFSWERIKLKRHLSNEAHNATIVTA